MRQKYNGRIYTYILAILILTTVIQVGTLWDIKGYGIPTSFLRFFSFSEKTNEPINKDEYFSPSKIVVSEGDNLTYWVLGKDSDSKFYGEIWSDAKEYLEKIISLNTIKPEIIDKNKWDMMARMSFIVEFESDMDCELISWFLGVGLGQIEFKNIRKIAICPENTFGVRKISVYIVSSEGIFKYPMDTVNIKKSINDKAIIEALKQDKNRLTYVTLGYIGFGGMSQIDDDVLVMADKKFWLNNVGYDIPELLKSGNKTDISTKIIGIQEGGYDFSKIDANKNFTFKDEYNIYKVYMDDGVLEYKYLTKVGNADPGSISQALDKAIEFIGTRKSKHLSGEDLKIYVTGIKKVINSNSNYYEFYFNYYYKDYPVSFIHKKREDFINNYNKGVLANAIVIRANSERVLECLWGLKEIQLLKDSYKYNLGYDTIADKRDFFIKDSTINDISIGYEINNNKSSSLRNVEPVWLVSYVNNNGRDIKSLALKKGGN